MTKRRAGSRTPGSLSRECASFDSRPLKVGNRPKILGCRQRATYRWKALDESYNFASDRTSIRGLLTKLWGSKVPGVPQGEISGLPAGSPGKKSHLDVVSAERRKEYYKGEGGGFPESGTWWVLWEKGSKVVAYSQARGVVCQSESEFTRGCPNTKRTRNEF